MWFTLIVGLLIANSALHFGLLWTVSSWAKSSRDALHLHQIPFRDGVNYFVQPWLGWYLDAWWISLSLLTALVVLLLINRDQLERGSS